MKRLMVIADEICFMDRPAVTGRTLGEGQWGLVGALNPIRQFSNEGEAVKWTALDPAPELSRQEIYHSYVEADFKNPSFRETILNGLKDDAFAEKLLQLSASYGPGKTGASIREALINDRELRAGLFTPEVRSGQMFAVETQEGRMATLQMIAVEASVRLTATLLNSEYYRIAPVSDDRVFPKLLAMRTTSSAYAGTTSKIAPFLGFQLVSAVIPDEVLQKLEIRDIGAYRKATSHAYTAWATEINKISSKIADFNSDVVESAIPKMIAEELMPKLSECRSEMTSVRDKLFGDLFKAVSKVHYQIPTLSFAYLTHNIMGSVASLIACYAPAVTPIITDYVTNRRATERKNYMSYLIGLTTRARD